MAQLVYSSEHGPCGPVSELTQHVRFRGKAVFVGSVI